jgi:site-specific DNA-methyltransferase (adenine-specific)
MYQTKINSKVFGNSRDDRAEWETPESFFQQLNEEFHFTLDAAASDANHKCKKYFTKDQDGLTQRWSGTVWCNPPYGKTIPQWLEKAIEEQRRGVTSVFLLMARTEMSYFHELIFPNAEIRFVKGRVKFSHPDPAKNKNNTPFYGSMLVIFKGA